MKNRSLILALLGVVVVGAGGYGLYRLGMNHAMQLSSTTTNSAPAAPSAASPQKRGDADAKTAKRVLHWHDPMVPGQKFDKPGKSPFMDMQLVPVYADSGGDEGAVKINPRMQQNFGVRTAEVRMGGLAPAVEAVG